ncbi:hypothetical protein CWB99_12045 [Pseudoalteromonas rubra]|uniref:Solute-binding protein family 3/N-terminal domain-containing protein n=1 Tax=Pseudoalteromonas rubra TaxID=43658 RepID=A0A5S3WN58_9GAMM|nr:hypothetical protein [Pseudoalteromonas rubra]TMP28296.1 hypothetical protein CWC00_21720 [Pseudoalteromonas rubra]TMP28318.1 hypothetical protein CWB99_12045 [Pseudoalteromonas rubra]
MFSDTAMQSLLTNHFPSLQKDKIRAHPRPFLNYRAHVLFPKSRKESVVLRDQFNRGLQTLKATGEFERQWQRLLNGEFVPER